MYEKTNNKEIDYSINYYNIYNKIIKPFEKIYNIYIFLSFFSINPIINYYKPYNIKLLNFNNNPINNILNHNIENIFHFQKEISLDFKFVLFFDIESIFKKNIIDFNFYINKFNLLSYFIPYIENKISNSDEFISIPYKFLSLFYNLLFENSSNKNICNLLFYFLKEKIGKNNFNFIIDNNFEKNNRTPLIKYLTDVPYYLNNTGFLLNNYYLYDIIYKNKNSQLIKLNPNEFYFKKKKTLKSEPFQWLGLQFMNFNNINKLSFEIYIEFEIKLIKPIIRYKNINYGLKIHEPISFFKDWINDCILDNYTKISFKININNKNQFILFNFDDYLDEIDFYLKDFKIIGDYN